MEIEAVNLMGMVREFGDRFNQVLRDDLEGLPPASRLFPKFYIKVVEDLTKPLYKKVKRF